MENKYKYSFSEAMELAEKKGLKFIGENDFNSYQYWFYDKKTEIHMLYNNGICNSELTINFGFVDQNFKEYKPNPNNQMSVNMEEKTIDVFEAMKQIYFNNKKFETVHKNKLYLDKNLYKKIFWFNKEDDKQEQFILREFINYKFKEYKPNPKIGKWYRPKIVWLENYDYPMAFSGKQGFKRHKDNFSLNNTKVLEWETIELPENYEECEHG